MAQIFYLDDLFNNQIYVPPNVEPAVHPETLTKIKPSEAIRLGRLLRPVVTSGIYFYGDNEACTIAAMALGFGLKPDGKTYHSVMGYLAYNFPEMPAYVRYQIARIPYEMDIRASTWNIDHTNKRATPKFAETPEEIEDSFIKALEAMGY